MDPATITAIMSVLGPALQAFSASQGKMGSTYGKGQQNMINDILKQVQGMRGSGGMDIAQNPQFQQGQEWLSGLFNDPEFFKSMEAPMMRKYNEEIIPGIANRFSGMGSGGSLGSTAFRNQLGRAGTDLSTNLAAMRGGMQQQGVNQSLQYAQQPMQNLMQMLGIGMTPYNNTYQPGFLG